MNPNYLSIVELNQRVALLLERNIPLLWVQGEISNFKAYPSGHWYFSLKDEQAQVRAVMFRPKNALLKWQPREGDRVQAYVAAGLYAPRGDFQVTVESMRPAGLGTLYERFIQLKETLAQRGWFDAAHKKPLPHLIRRVGVITSPQAAALRDVAHTLARRAPHVEVLLFPTVVQGETAAAQIAQAIAQANDYSQHQTSRLDALLLIRGGGSLEDLWAFNEEAVACALFDSRLPIISGVGHETDTTIADFVADLRAATPTAAAELVSSPSQADWMAQLNDAQTTLRRTMRRQTEQHAQRLDNSMIRLLTPAQQFAHRQYQVAQLANRLTQNARASVQSAQSRYAFQAARFVRNRPDVVHVAAPLEQQRHRLQQAFAQTLQQQYRHTEHLAQRLHGLSPDGVLARGYAYVQTQSGDIVYNADELHAGDGIRIRLGRGRVVGTVNHTEPD